MKYSLSKNISNLDVSYIYNQFYYVSQDEIVTIYVNLLTLFSWIRR